MRRVRLSKQSPLQGFINRYGVGGLDNYSPDQAEAILEALYLILQNSGSTELHFLGKFFLKLSDEPVVAQRLLEELEQVVGL